MLNHTRSRRAAWSTRDCNASTFNTAALATDTASTSPRQTSNNTDTVAVFITLAKLLDKTISGLNSQGVTIDSLYPFMSLREEEVRHLEKTNNKSC